jgi:4-amino-4-deoxy-L-arabinose transferase-like glycosyltransferase
MLSFLVPLKKYSIRVIFWLIAIVLGFLQGWAYPYTMNPDGMSYLDVGEAYLQGQWNVAINAYWSPLYSWILGLAISIVKPSAYWEFPLVRLVNLLIYLLSLLCFEFFLNELILYYQEKIYPPSASAKVFLKIPKWIFLVLGYTLFIWCSLNFIRAISIVTPDMCIAAFICLASGMVLRLTRQPENWLNFILLGLVLGLGYLAKSVMFPLAFVFLLVGLFSLGNLRQALPKILVSVLVFTIIISPFVGAISLAKGRLTIGDSGKLNHAWLTYEIPRLPPWGDEKSATIDYKHPPKKIFDNPPVYEYGTVVGGSYPYWYDPSYWHEGLKSKLNLVKQIKASANLLYFYQELFYFRILIWVYLIFVYVGNRFRFILKDLTESWRLLIPALAGLGIYLLVGYAEMRYIAPFILLLFSGVFLSIRLPNSQQSKKWLAGMTIATLIIVGGLFSIQGAENFVKGIKITRNVEWQITENLNQLGIQTGDKVAIIKTPEASFPYWARLGRFKIVAELSNAKGFWATDAATKSEIYKVIEKTGAKAIIQVRGSNATPPPPLIGWQRIAGIDCYVYVLPK